MEVEEILKKIGDGLKFEMGAKGEEAELFYKVICAVINKAKSVSSVKVKDHKTGTYDLISYNLTHIKDGTKIKATVCYLTRTERKDESLPYKEIFVRSSSLTFDK